MYQIGRISAWDVRSNPLGPNRSPNKIPFCENTQFNFETQMSAFNDVQKDKLITTIDAFIKNNSYSTTFADSVTDDIAPNYLNYIAVEMNLGIIKDNIDNGKYRSKAMLMFDLKQIELNCIEFNGIDHKITKDATKLYENLRKLLDQVLSYRLRNIPQRNVSGRNRGHSSTSEPSEIRSNKRNPKKMSTRRIARKRGAYDIEESKDEDVFKKPTPQKYQKIADDDESDPNEIDHNFKIQLEGVSTNSVRRSTRRFAVSFEKEPPSLNNSQSSKRLSKNILKEQSTKEEEEYVPRHSRNTRASAKPQKKVKYEEQEDDSEYDEEDY